MHADLREVVERIDALGASFSCSIGLPASEAPGRWATASELASVRGVALDDLMQGYGAAWGVIGDRRSQAAFVILDYTWYVAAPLVAAHLVCGRLPSLEGAAVRLDAGSRSGALALATGPSRRSSPDLLADELVGHLRPLVERVADRGWLSARAAWLGVGDRLVGAFEHVGDLIGQRDRAQSDAAAIVHRAGSELDSPRHRFATYQHRGVARTVGVRASCCRFYRTPDARYCLTCPLVTEDERTERMRDWIARDLTPTETTNQGDS